MYQAFVIVLREGFESFLIVAIIAAYLGKTGRKSLMPAVWRGIAASVAVSVVLGFLLLEGANQPLWEGVLGLVSAVLVAFFVVHMWRTAPHLKSDIESRLRESASVPSTRTAAAGVFAFTTFMIAREGMETALLLIQVHSPQVVTGSFLGILGAAAMALLWLKVGHLINLKLFFQVTAIFLLLFVIQILIYSFHEFTETGIFPQSEALHIATEPYGPEGIYGRWLSVSTITICAAWLVLAGAKDMLTRKKTAGAG